MSHTACEGGEVGQLYKGVFGMVLVIFKHRCTRNAHCTLEAFRDYDAVAGLAGSTSYASTVIK